MYSRSSEPVRFERDCAAVLVPQGDEVTLPAGTVAGYRAKTRFAKFFNPTCLLRHGMPCPYRDGDDPMEMIWHNNIFATFDIGVFVFQIPITLLDYFTIWV